MRKKVCHFSAVHKGLDVRIFRKECVSLARAGYDTHLVINAGPTDVAEAARYDVTLHPLDYPTKSGRMSRMSRHAYHCYRIARALDADVYHFHDPELVPYGLLLASAGKEVIYDVHEDLYSDIQSKTWIPKWARQTVAIAARGAEHFGAGRFAAIVASSQPIGALFAHTARRLVIVNNYPLLSELPEAPDHRGSPRDAVCYVGGIDGTRGIREMVTAVGHVGVRLLLAGTFSSAALRSELTQYPGWTNVEDFGYLDRAGVIGLLRQSFAGLVVLEELPNYLVALPVKMFEYMAAGIPVISSLFPNWQAIVDGEQCGICVNPKDTRAIAEAICYLRDHPEEAAWMGQNGRRAVETKYRWEEEQGKLLALYQELLEDRKEPQRLRWKNLGTR
jgi:glycosyltransferase involved in cell wall biosynthesis